MRKDYLFVSCLVLLLFCTLTQALSQVSVSGTVRDENNSALPGVNILVKGSSTGTITGSDGRYQITTPDDNTVLVFSFIGYSEQEVPVGGRTSIDVSMALDVTSLDEVVVTALGIERTSKSLGYATSKVNSEQIATNRTPNWMNGLTGKIAGVAITSLGTGPGGTSKVRIRGQASIGGTSNPLIVINGVPVDNTSFGTNPGNVGSDGTVGNRGGGVTSDGGDALASINPDDIESMTVLKGASASALYGSRAASGVLMITTKSKGASKGIGISYNMNYTNETPLDFTDYQKEYGQGEYGVLPTTPNPTSGQWSFGPKIQPGMTHTLFNTPGIPYEAQPSRIKEFYRHGSNMTNTVALSSMNEKGGLNLSVGDTKSNGITPNNSFNRQTVNLGFAYDLSSKISFRGNINYSKEYNKNPPVVSEQDNSIPTSLFALASTMPLEVMEANMYHPVLGGEYTWSRFTNRVNPYWALAEQRQNVRRDRLFGNLAMKFDITNWLSLQGRIGQDYFSRDQDYINLPTGKASLNGGSINSAVAGFVNGVFTQDQRRYREINADFLLTAAKTFNDFGINVNFGGNQLRRRVENNSVQVTDFVVKGLYTVQNGRAKDPIYDLSERQVNSLYGAAEFNYKQLVYLTATYRNDWFSTLAPENRSFPYASVSSSLVFSELIKPAFLDFGKLRLSYAQVGSDSDVGPYAQQLLYGVNANQFGGQPVANFGLTVPNAHLNNSLVNEAEGGFEMRMFNNRVGIDFAAYHKLTFDQIVNAQISDASGFTQTRINSGKSQNNGLELMVNLVPVKSSDFSWDFTFTGSYNKTKVLSLLTDVEGSNITVGNHVFNGSVQQIVGKEMGQIVGFGYRRDDGSINPDHAGMIVYGSNGIALPTLTQIPFGSALHKWVGGFMNSFNYKGIMVSFLIDFKLGGKMLSGTNFNAWRHGLHKATLVGRDVTTYNGVTEAGGIVVGEGVNAASQINTVGARVEDFYSVVRGSALIEPVIYNAGFWKLRQLSIGYDFTRFVASSTPIKGLRLDFVSNNVLMLKKWVDNIDPEGYTYTSDNLVGMESPGLPTTRSMGFNLNVKF